MSCFPSVSISTHNASKINVMLTEGKHLIERSSVVPRLHRKKVVYTMV
jgi:hypothetical protein